MAPAKKLKKPKGKSKGKLNTTRTVRKVDRETNQKLKISDILIEVLEKSEKDMK